MKVGDMWGFEIDKTDGKVITGLVRVSGSVNIAGTSGANSKEGRLRFSVEPLRWDKPPTVEWVSHDKYEEDDAYAERVLRRVGASGLGAARGWPSLGVRTFRKEDEDTGERYWTLEGIPRTASSEDILGWAEEVGLR